jgi:hypothetical protein
LDFTLNAKLWKSTNAMPFITPCGISGVYDYEYAV